MTDGNDNPKPPAQPEVKTANDLVIEELKKQNELLKQQNEQLTQANNDLWAILHPADNKQIVVDKKPAEQNVTPYDIVADVTAKLKAL
jgi:predicted HAD superfamily Cof-like phosphohydrolase